MNKLAEWGRKLKGIAKPQKCSNPKEWCDILRTWITLKSISIISPRFKLSVSMILSRSSNLLLEKSVRLGVKIMQFIVDNDIREFADLAEYCLIHNEVWDDYLAKSTYYIKRVCGVSSISC